MVALRLMRYLSAHPIPFMWGGAAQLTRRTALSRASTTDTAEGVDLVVLNGLRLALMQIAKIQQAIQELRQPKQPTQ